MGIYQTSQVSGPGLKRALRLPALVLYGIIVIQPTAPMPLYGATNSLANGHMATMVKIGMVAMLFTAISYGRMANIYPNAGSEGKGRNNILVQYRNHSCMDS